MLRNSEATRRMDTKSMADRKLEDTDETWLRSVEFWNIDVEEMTGLQRYHDYLLCGDRVTCISERKRGTSPYEWSSDNYSWGTKRDSMSSGLASKMETTANKLRMWYESSYSLYPTCVGWYDSFMSAGSSAFHVLQSPRRRTRVRSPYSLILLTLFFSHAVFLHSGFVGLDQTSWSLTDSKILARYTLPAILANESRVKENVLLEFRSYGNSVVVNGSSGSLSDSSSLVYRVCLDENMHGPDLRLMLAMSESKSGCRANTEHGFRVFHIWNLMKDQLALPILNDLCERAGLNGFMGLPTDVEHDFMGLPLDVKLEILKYLPAKYIYKMASLSEDLKYLLKDKLWWRKRCERVMAKNNMDACSEQKKTD